jgi:hypothetical protein
MEFFNLQELKNLLNILKSSSSHVCHLLSLFDALFNRDKICLVVVVSHHGFLHFCQIFFNFNFTFIQCFIKEGLLLGESLSLLSQVLPFLLEDLILFYRDLIFVLEVVNLPFELNNLDFVVLLELLDLVFETFKLLIPKIFLLFFLSSELGEFVGQFIMFLEDPGKPRILIFNLFLIV